MKLIFCIAALMVVFLAGAGPLVDKTPSDGASTWLNKYPSDDGEAMEFSYIQVLYEE